MSTASSIKPPTSLKASRQGNPPPRLSARAWRPTMSLMRFSLRRKAAPGTTSKRPNASFGKRDSGCASRLGPNRLRGASRICVLEWDPGFYNAVFKILIARSPDYFSRRRSNSQPCWLSLRFFARTAHRRCRRFGLGAALAHRHV